MHTIGGQTIEAGHVGPTSSRSFTIPFSAGFSQPPVVLLTVDERGDNSGATACRIESLSNTAASGRCWSNSTGEDADGVYYIALEPTPPEGLAYNGRRIHAGRATGASGASLLIPTPDGIPGVPHVMALTVENNGTSGGPSIARTHRASNGSSVETRSWHCPAGDARTPFALHWVFID